MRVRVGGVERSGRAVDLRDVDVSPGAVVAAVRDPDDDRVECGPPQCTSAQRTPPQRTPPQHTEGTVRTLHDRVGHLRRDASVAAVAAVAAAARTRGATTGHDAELRAVAAELTSLEVPDVDLTGARERVAEAASDVDRLRERVARSSGRVEARRDGDGDTADAEADLQAATRELADRETELHAAREALAAARRRAREARDARERRLELEDRRDNLRRAARRALADRYADSFRRAVAALPVPGEPASPGSFEGPDWAAACAVARLARPGAPLVVEGVFADPSRARAALDAPVLLAAE